MDIKKLLCANGYVMKSETDTEVIVNLISFYYKSEKDVIDSIKKCTHKLEGTWGLVIMCLDDPNYLYTTRLGSPYFSWI